MIKASAITFKKLKNRQFQAELPELFALENFIENNAWHNNDSVFNHTLAVLNELEKLFKNINPKIKDYLNQKLDRHSRKELLFLGTMFHDIGKSEVLVKRGKSTSYPQHEVVGSEKVKAILDRLDLSVKEKAIIVRIVKYHGEIHLILDPKNDKRERQFNQFKSKRRDLFVELILLALADTLGSQLKDNDPDNFQFRIKFYQQIIDNC